MKSLTAPIHVLKSQAKKIKKEEGISQVEALNKVALREGYSSWSLLMHEFEREKSPRDIDSLLSSFHRGDLILLGARPGIGKTHLATFLFVKFLTFEKKSFFMTLNDSHKKVVGRIAEYDERIGFDHPFVNLDYSDEICASYIIEQYSDRVEAGSLIVIDFLQLLDEKKSKPILDDQLKELKSWAREKGVIILIISQLDRSVDDRIVNKRPKIKDIRMPNPFDLSCFNKIILLDRSQDKAMVYGEKPHAYNFPLSWNGQRFC